MKIKIWINTGYKWFLKTVVLKGVSRENGNEMLWKFVEHHKELAEDIGKAEVCIIDKRAHISVKKLAKISDAERQFDALCGSYGFDDNIIAMLKLLRLGKSDKEIELVLDIRVSTAKQFIKRRMNTLSIGEAMYLLGMYAF